MLPCQLRDLKNIVHIQKYFSQVKANLGALKLWSESEKKTDIDLLYRHRLEWMGALTKAVDNSGEGVRYQIGQARQRRQQREEELARRLSHMDIVEQTKY